MAWVDPSFICMRCLNRASVRLSIYGLACVMALVASGLVRAQDGQTFHSSKPVTPSKPAGSDDSVPVLPDPDVKFSPMATSIRSVEWQELRGLFSSAIRQGDIDLLERLLTAGVSLDDWEGTGDDGLMAHCIRQSQFQDERILQTGEKRKVNSWVVICQC